MKNIDSTLYLQLTEEQAYMDSNSIDMVLEQFFNNVLECINFEEENCVLNCI